VTENIRTKPLSEYNLTVNERLDVMAMLSEGWTLQEALDAVYESSMARAEHETIQSLRMAGAW